ncbi:MAG: ketoacyl-ACP synthase III [Deltaproteobacteria bacterium]|nr:ketoacyl-ACP synthase III [Deltaproteobacteria bacterium]
MSLYTQIIATGSYVPPTILTNDDISQRLDTDDAWIFSRTGIRERHVVDKETCSDLAAKASFQALERANLKPDQLDMIIVATLTPEKRLPATANFLQHKLQAKRAACFDVDVACAGFMYGLSIAHQYIQNREMKTILVVGAEVMSRILNWNDRSTCVLFGDGAGACIVGSSSKKERAVMATRLYSNGSLSHLLEIPGGGTACDWTPEMLERQDQLIKMDGKEVYKEAVRCMTEAAQEMLERHHLSIQDIDLFIPHQANLRIIEAVAKRLDFPLEKIFMNLDRYGNTSAASIPIALDEAIQSHRIERGQRILMISFGAGFAWASSLIEW